MKRTGCVAFAAALWSALAFAGMAQAQSYPAKPVRLISSLPPGSNGDVAGRLMTPKMGEHLGQPVVFESRTGANGTIAAGAVATAAPDGYSLLYVGAGTMVSNRFLMKNPPFDSVKDFTPISQASKAVTFLAVNAAVPVSAVKDFIDHVKSHPGKLSYGSTGIGSPFHMMGESLSSAARLDMVHVPYSGRNSANAVNDLLTGRIQVYFPSYTNIRQHIDSGKVRLLAVMDTSRYKRLPDVPALTEFVPAYKPVPSWNGFFGPAGLPQPIVARVHAAILAALDDASIEARLDEVGIRKLGSTPEAFARTLVAEIDGFGETARAIGLQPQ
ncbi:MAG: hypothetical protein A3I01_08890 [Betaproteobacteria bacterium RIFCSPLOWO2_02_FULL_65_24]|nr:MAG: hypothetical protein A3I01_08890 [Betaproteobacteria bacterium RIFCSPLOWO2_02_FULL_65_24]